MIMRATLKALATGFTSNGRRVEDCPAPRFNMEFIVTVGWGELANLPAPECYAVHKLIVYGERPVHQRAKAGKDILQAACLVEYFLASGRQTEFNASWRDALSRGKGWQARAWQGQKALMRIAPGMMDKALWHA